MKRQKNATVVNIMSLRQKRIDAANKNQEIAAANRAQAVLSRAIRKAIQTGVNLPDCDKDLDCCGNGNKHEETGDCTCYKGFGGGGCNAFCDDHSDSGGCCGNGERDYVNNTCSCNDGFSGDDCSEGEVCGGNGVRVNGACMCSAEWTGLNCTTKAAVSTISPSEASDDKSEQQAKAEEGMKAAKGERETISGSVDERQKGFSSSPTGKATLADKGNSNRTKDAIDAATAKQKAKARAREAEIQRQNEESVRQMMVSKAENFVKKLEDNAPEIRINDSATDEQKAAAARTKVAAVQAQAKISGNGTVGGNDKIMEMAGNIGLGKSPEGQLTAEQEKKIETEHAEAKTSSLTISKIENERDENATVVKKANQTMANRRRLI